LAGSLLVPLALYSFYSTGEVRMRHFSLALPWVMLAAAIGVDWWARVLETRLHSTLPGLVGLLMLLAGAPVVGLDTAPSGMTQVLAALASEPRVASTNGPVFAFYTTEGRTNARLRGAFVNTPTDLAALATAYPTLVVDMQAELFPGDLTEAYARQ